MAEVSLHVAGNPRAKQSFRVGSSHGYIDPMVRIWQDMVRVEALSAMKTHPPLTGGVWVTLEFYMPTRRRVDVDNLSKAVLDALKGVVYEDDRQIVRLVVNKYFRRIDSGVTITVEEVPHGIAWDHGKKGDKRYESG